MKEITPYEALKRMRELTAAGVPFRIEFYSYNSTKEASEGYKVIEKALLRQGLRDDQSSIAKDLIGYVDYAQGDVPRFFHLPLLMKFNDYNITP